MVKSFVHNFFFRTAIALIAGEAVAFIFPEYSSGWMVGAVMLAVLVLAAVGWGWKRTWLPMVFLAGMTLAAWTDFKFISVAASGKPVVAQFEVEGVDADNNGNSKISFISSYKGIPVRVVASRPEDGFLPKRGDVWECTGRLSPPMLNSQRFRPRKFWALDPDAVRKTGEVPLGVRARFDALAESLSARLELGLEDRPEIADLHRAMLLGRRTSIPSDMKKIFAGAGTIHIFAISGLHVMIISLLCIKMLLFFGMSRRTGEIVSLVLVTGFVMVSGARASAIRALAMLFIYYLSPYVNRDRDAVTSWSLTAAAVYFIDPTKIFDPGCLMSFTVMLGIVIWCQWMRLYVPKSDIVPRKIKELQRRGHSVYAYLLRRAYGIVTSKIGAIGVTVAAFFAGTPITARLFGRLIPGSLLANMFVIALAPAAVIGAAAALILSFVSPTLAAWVNQIAGWFTMMMIEISRLTAAIPYASMETHEWTLGECFVWYMVAMLGLMLLSIVIAKWRNRKRWL